MKHIAEVYRSDNFSFSLVSDSSTQKVQMVLSQRDNPLIIENLLVEDKYVLEKEYIEAMQYMVAKTILQLTFYEHERTSERAVLKEALEVLSTSVTKLAVRSENKILYLGDYGVYLPEKIQGALSNIVARLSNFNIHDELDGLINFVATAKMRGEVVVDRFDYLDKDWTVVYEKDYLPGLFTKGVNLTLRCKLVSDDHSYPGLLEVERISKIVIRSDKLVQIIGRTQLSDIINTYQR